MLACKAMSNKLAHSAFYWQLVSEEWSGIHDFSIKISYNDCNHILDCLNNIDRKSPTAPGLIHEFSE